MPRSIADDPDSWGKPVTGTLPAPAPPPAPVPGGNVPAIPRGRSIAVGVMPFGLWCCGRADCQYFALCEIIKDIETRQRGVVGITVDASRALVDGYGRCWRPVHP